MRSIPEFPDPSPKEWADMSIRDKRKWLSERFLWEAKDLLDGMRKPTVVVGFTNGKAIRVQLKEPPAGDKRSLMVAAAVAIDKSLALERHDAGQTGLAAVDEWLRHLLDGSTDPE